MSSDNDKPSDDTLDSQIKWQVQLLQDNDIETFESCQGGTGHVFHYPTIRFHGGAGEGPRAFGILTSHGFQCAAVGRYWDVLGDVMHGPYWEIILAESKNPSPTLDALDRDAIDSAIAIRQRSPIPNGTGPLRDRVIAEICRGWMEMLGQWNGPVGPEMEGKE